jgi:predicted transcriptional regulator
MAGERTTTIRMDARMLKRVDGIARAMSRSRAWVINDAIERYLDYEEWFVGAVKQGLKQAEAGDVVEHEAVVKAWEEKGAAKVDAGR